MISKEASAVGKWFRDLPINSKFLFCLTLMIILPVLLAFLVVHNNYEKESWQKYDEQRYLTLMEKNNRLSYMLRELSDSYVKTIYDTNFRLLERQYWLKNELGYERMRHEITVSFMRDYGSRPYSLAMCLSHDGQIIFQYNRDSLRYEAINEANLMQGDKRFELTRFSREQLYKNGDSSPQISIVGRIASTASAGEPMTLRLSVPESYAFGLIDDKVYHGTSCYVVDSGGSIISASDKALLGQQFSSYVEMDGGLSGSGAYHSRVSAALGGARSQYLMLSYTVQGTDWNLVYFIPASSLDTRAGVTTALTIISVIACALFGALFYMVLLKSIIRPLNSLKDEMVLVGEGGALEAAQERGDEVRLLRESFEDMVVRINDLIEKVYKAQLREKDAQYQALVSQINPHFLYNTLDSIRFSALLNKDMQVAEQIETLSQIFRHVLSFEGETPTIADELKHLKNYIAIQRLRFDDRISYEISCPDELLGCESLKLLLQPLCENAIMHGHESSMTQGHISVRISEQPPGTLVCEVEDDGLGTDADAVNRELEQNNVPGSMIALKGIRERIRIKYGPEYGMSFESEPGRGTLVTVRIPKIGGEHTWK